MLPLLLLAIPVALKGLENGVQGKKLHERAEQLKNAQRKRFDEAAGRLQGATAATNERIASLVSEQRTFVHGTARRFLEVLRRLERNGSVRDTQILEALDVTAASLREVELPNLVFDTANGVAQGAALGATASVTMLLGVSVAGTASTGTAIAGLSGAAATNATLASLGGGALAAGGMGIAGGMAFLGGLVAAPVLAVAGSAAKNAGEKALTEAEQFQAEVERFIATVETKVGLIAAIGDRADELKALLAALVDRANRVLAELEADLFDASNGEDIARFQRAGRLVGAAAEIVRTPLFDQNGSLSDASSHLRARFVALVREDA